MLIEIMSQHYIVKCRECQTVLSQCRCAADIKEIRWGCCGSCQPKMEPGVSSWMDEQGACKICQGEIPYGHARTCIIHTMSEQIRKSSEAFNDKCAAAEAWEGTANQYKDRAGEMQLVAGRYQYQFEHAMKCINSIDDLFEYAYKGVGRTALRDMVRSYLAVFTAAVKPKGK